MTTLIWFFSVSLAILVIMVSYRAYEIKKNKLIFSTEIRTRADNFILRIFSKLIIFYKNQSLRLKIFLQRLKHQIHEKLHFAWRKLSDKVDGYFLKIRGRRNIGKKGSISIYWQQVQKKSEENSEEEEG